MKVGLLIKTNMMNKLNLEIVKTIKKVAFNISIDDITVPGVQRELREVRVLRDGKLIKKMNIGNFENSFLVNSHRGAKIEVKKYFDGLLESVCTWIVDEDKVSYWIPGLPMNIRPIKYNRFSNTYKPLIKSY